MGNWFCVSLILVTLLVSCGEGSRRCRYRCQRRCAQRWWFGHSRCRFICSNRCMRPGGSWHRPSWHWWNRPPYRPPYRPGGYRPPHNRPRPPYRPPWTAGGRPRPPHWYRPTRHDQNPLTPRPGLRPRPTPIRIVIEHQAPSIRPPLYPEHPIDQQQPQRPIRLPIYGTGYNPMAERDQEMKNSSDNRHMEFMGSPNPSKDDEMKKESNETAVISVAGQYEEAFRQFDKDGDNFLELSEWLTMFSTGQAQEDYFKKADTNGDKKLSLEEFRTKVELETDDG